MVLRIGRLLNKWLVKFVSIDHDIVFVLLEVDFFVFKQKLVLIEHFLVVRMLQLLLAFFLLLLGLFVLLNLISQVKDLFPTVFGLLVIILKICLVNFRLAFTIHNKVL